MKDLIIIVSNVMIILEIIPRQTGRRAVELAVCCMTSPDTLVYAAKQLLAYVSLTVLCETDSTYINLLLTRATSQKNRKQRRREDRAAIAKVSSVFRKGTIKF